MLPVKQCCNHCTRLIFRSFFRLKNELELLQKANHTNILRVHGWTKWCGSMALVMEYMPGGNLRRLLHDQNIPLPIVLRLRMCAEIASGISFIHNFNSQQGLLHGDLKPDNILLSQDLHCIIGDFGGARLMKYTTSTVNSSRPTQRDQMTRAYAPPERLADGPRPKPKKEHDTYSFGIIVHSVLSRETPLEMFRDETDYVEAIKRGDRPDRRAIEILKEGITSEVEKSIIDILESVMTRCWQEIPDERPNMPHVRNELNTHLGKLSPETIQQSVTSVLSYMRFFLPSKTTHHCVPLRNFNTRTGDFHTSMSLVMVTRF